jgi:NAD(P)-dependent dehydrogenase (short-subunit alcohol dehydrogenase family)
MAQQAYFNLAGKVALVTGASSGLGVHFAKLLASEGAIVILAARREAKLAEHVEEIRQAGGQAYAVSMDVLDASSVTRAFDTLAQLTGPIDILINNAGVASEPKSFLNTNEEDWAWVIDTNLTGAWRVARTAAMQMIDASKSGCIVNIASIYGLNTGVMKVAYNASKAAVVQLTKSMSMELTRKNIRVNALCPGWVKTDLNSAYFESDSGKKYIQTIPAKRLGEYADLTVPLLLLASDASDYMTGTTLVVDGGISESPV